MVFSTTITHGSANPGIREKYTIRVPTVTERRCYFPVHMVRTQRNMQWTMHVKCMGSKRVLSDGCGSESHPLRHPGTQQMIEGILSEVESPFYWVPRNPLIYQGNLGFTVFGLIAFFSCKSLAQTCSGCFCVFGRKNPFEIVLHCPGVCIFPSNSLALAILPAPAWGSDLLR